MECPKRKRGAVVGRDERMEQRSERTRDVGPEDPSVAPDVPKEDGRTERPQPLSVSISRC